MYFCYGYVLWIFLSWLPTYFAEVRGFGLGEIGNLYDDPSTGWNGDQFVGRLVLGQTLCADGRFAV